MCVCVCVSLYVCVFVCVRENVQKPKYVPWRVITSSWPVTWISSKDSTPHTDISPFDILDPLKITYSPELFYWLSNQNISSVMDKIQNVIFNHWYLVHWKLLHYKCTPFMTLLIITVINTTNHQHFVINGKEPGQKMKNYNNTYLTN